MRPRFLLVAKKGALLGRRLAFVLLLAPVATLASGCREDPLTDARIDAVLRASRTQIAGECLKRELVGMGDLADVSVAVRLDVNAKGDVVYARATSDGGAPTAVSACVEHRVALLHFPASDSGKNGIERSLVINMKGDAQVSLTW